MPNPLPPRAAAIAEPGISPVLLAPRKASPYRKAMPTRFHTGKRAEDTMAGCRIRAAADLDKAAAPEGRYMRGRLEHSAAMWSDRAELLGRIEAGSEKRKRAKSA